MGKGKTKRKRCIAIMQAVVFFATSLATGFTINVGSNVAKAEVVKDNIVTINLQLAYQTWQGWGTSLCWWGNAVGGFKDIAPTTAGAAKGYANRYEEIMDLVFGADNGLGLNIVRYNIGGGDDESLDFINRSGAKIPGYMDANGVYNWDADKNQVTVLKDAYQMVKDSGQTFYNQMFSNSPPYFMTYSGSSTGGSPATKDQLKWDKYNDFADYLLEVSNYIQSVQGVPITDIEPINEPTSGYWGYASQKQEGAQFNMDPQPSTHTSNYDATKDPYDPAVYSAMNKMYEILGDKLAERQANGQLQGVQITGTDETSIDVQKKAFLKLTDKSKNFISKISTHEYGGSDRIGLYNIAAAYDKDLWQDEVSFGGGARNETAMDSGAFAVSDAIRKDMNDMRASAWIGWQAVESMGENIFWNSNWGFIHAVYENPAWKTGTTTDWSGNAVNGADTDPNGISKKQYDKSFSGYTNLVTPDLYNSMGLKRGDYYTTKQYYTLGQYSRYIKEGYQVIDVSDSNYVAALSPDKKQLVFVVTNNTTDDKPYSVQLDNMTNFGTVKAIRTSATEAWADVASPGSVTSGVLNITAKANSVTTYIVSALSGQVLKTDDVNGHYVSAAIKKVDLSKDGIDKFVYTGAWQDLTDAEYYQNYASKSSTVGDTVTFEFEGKMASIYGSTSTEGGMMAISVDGAKEVFVDTYATVGKKDTKLYTTDVLADGVHTVTIRNAANKNVLSKGNDVIISHALSANGKLTEKDQLKITSFSAMQGKIGIVFSELSGVDSYTVKYGLKSGDYTFTDTNVSGSPYYITNLASGATYFVVVTAIKDGQEIVSNEISATPKEADGNVLYYVNCGAPSPEDTGDSAEKLGIYNSSADQPYGKDAVTNMAWGYDTANGTWARTTPADKWDSIRCDTSDSAGGTIKYSFEIPNGSYEVSVGIYDPWNNTNRKTDLVINSVVKRAAFVVGSSKVTETNTIDVTNGRIDVGVARSAGVIDGSLDPQVSWIRISQVVVENIKSVNTFTPVTVPLGEIPTLPANANVVYMDDTTGTVPITWDTVSSDMFTVGFKPVTIKGRLQNSSKIATYTVTPMPSKYLYIMDLASNANLSTNSTFIDGLVASTSSTLLNPVREQKSDGTTWGWLPNADDSSNLGANNADGQFKSLRYANNSNKTIDTVFPITNGTYDVAIGTSNPWGSWGRGNNDFYAEGTKLLTEDIPGSDAIHVLNNVKVVDGVLNVSVKASAGNSNAAVMSWIAIYPHYQTVNALTFTQGGYIVQKGQTFLLPYTVTPTLTGVTFTSSNEGVATVAADGTVTAKGYGSATITAIAGDAMAKCVIIVPEGASGVVGADTANIGYGKTTVLTYLVEPENAVNKNLVITSSDPSKIQIVSTQRVGAITYVTIKATAEVGDSAVVKATLEGNPSSFKDTVVSVSDLKVSGIRLDKTTLALTANGDASIASGSAIGAGFVREGSVQAEFLVDGELCPVNRSVEWTIVNGSDCIDIEPNGNQVVVKSKKVGEADVLARIETMPGSLEYVEKLVHISITAEPLVISSVDALGNVKTVIGKQPVLPTTVRVYYTNNSYGDVNISWNAFNQDSLYSLGDFTVNGTIIGTTEAVSVTVTVDQKSIKDTNITGIASQVYQDKPVTLPIAIYDGTRLLVEGTDYTLAYHNNDKLGDATVVIQGINKYNDTISYDYTLYKASVSEVVTIKSVQISRTPSNLHYIEGETLDTTGLALTVNYSNGSSQDITGGYTVNETKLSTIGTNVITVSYQGHIVTFEVYVREKQVIQVEKVTDPTKLQYNVGDTINTAGLSLKVRYDNKEEKTIDSGYSVDTTLLNTPGKISVKVTYKDRSVYFTVTVMPKNVEDVKVEALTKNSAKVKWTKQSKVSGYQVYMATSKKGKYVKVATVAGSKSAYTVKKLEESQTYYFKVRSYKLVDGVRKYGKYSTIAVREGK